MSNLISVPESQRIEIRKRISRLLSDAQKIAKPDKCILCGLPQTSFCNSHSVPQMSLNSIAENGKLYLASALMGIEVVNVEDGVKRSGTFHFICNDCDNTYFQDYENENNLCYKPTDKMLAEIAVKNILLQLSKKNDERALNELLQKRFDAFENPEDRYAIDEIDIRDYEESLEVHRNVIRNNESGCYQIIYWKILPYKVPIAVQSAVTLYCDMEGNIINDVYDMSENTRMQFLHLAVLPLKECSVVLAFYHKKDRRYKKLWHQFNAISEEERLKFLNYIIFAHTENFFMSKKVLSEIETNEKLTLLSQENHGNPALGFLDLNNQFGYGYESVTKDEIPNFLSESWGL